MKYELSGISATGTAYPENINLEFVPWQPSTWPEYNDFGPGFLNVLKKILYGTVIDEIGNVISDIEKSNGNLEHRGHIIAISLLCAVDAIGCYGYRGNHFSKFIENNFPNNYRPFAVDIYKLYRNSLIHNWNLFEVGILPNNQEIMTTSNSIVFGLLNFFNALKEATSSFLKKLETEKSLQNNTLNKYSELRKTAKK